MDAEEIAAADKIAAVKKGQKARKEAAETKQAATTVAAAQRGRQERKKRKEEDKASVAIQSRIRGRKARARGTKDKGGGQRYFTPAEVGMHNTADDCWVSIFHYVLDLSALIKGNAGSLVQPLIDNAGTDITHWFDPITKDVRTYIDPKTELEVPFTPMGSFLHCPPSVPTSSWSPPVGTVWWRDKGLRLGKLTEKTRHRPCVYELLRKRFPQFQRATLTLTVRYG